MKKQLFALTMATAIAFASLTAKADTFYYSFTGNDGVVATGSLTGSSAPTGGFDITSGTIFMTGAFSALDGSGVLVLNTGQVFQTGGGTNVNAAGTDSLLFPFTNQIIDNTGLFLFQMNSGQGAVLFSNEPQAPGYGMFGGNWTLNDTGDLTVSPEPSSLMLLGTGLLGVVGVARKKFHLT
jgi:hypothetical protein